MEKRNKQQQKRTEEERNKFTHLEIGGNGGGGHFMWRCVDNKCGNN